MLQKFVKQYTRVKILGKLLL